jgi:hypothetical protein
VFVVAEVKSITRPNEVKQLRLGLGQVLDYAHAIERSGRSARAVLAVELKPRDDRWIELCRSHDVTLTWPDEWPEL